MIKILKEGYDRIVYNTKKVDMYGWRSKEPYTHTHIPIYIFSHPNEVAEKLQENVEHKKVPRQNNSWVIEYVGDAYERFIESHIRVADDEYYIYKLNHILEKKRDKQNYHNLTGGGKV